MNRCDDILRMVAGGVYLRDACEVVGLDRDTFLQWRLQDDALSRRYFEARASWAMVRLDDAMGQLAQASTPVACARWRAIVRALQWEAERLLVQYRKASDPVTISAERTIVIRWEDHGIAPGENPVPGASLVEMIEASALELCSMDTGIQAVSAPRE